MKLRNSIKLFIASTLIMSVAQPTFARPEVRALQKDVPQEVAALIHRIVECNYWAGEVPMIKNVLPIFNARSKNFVAINSTKTNSVCNVNMAANLKS